MIDFQNDQGLGKYLSACHSPAVAFLILLGILLIGCSLKSHPADHVMEEKFQSNREDFNRLAMMLGEDSDIDRLSQKSVTLEENSKRSLTEERLRDYRGLFVKLGLTGGMYRDRGDAIRLIASPKHTLLMDSEKSYVYSATPPSPVVQSLDKVIGSDRGDQLPIYKQIADNWYLYYESW